MSSLSERVCLACRKRQHSLRREMSSSGSQRRKAVPRGALSRAVVFQLFVVLFFFLKQQNLNLMIYSTSRDPIYRKLKSEEKLTSEV